MKKMNWLVWLLIAIPALGLAASAAAKLSGAEPVMTGMAKYGIADQVTLLGILELLIVVLFVYPATRNIGFFLICSYLGGAIATHATHNEPIMSPVILLSLVWVAMVYQKPYLFWGGTAPR